MGRLERFGIFFGAEIISQLKEKGIKVVVWDMDHTMSAMHCGTGIRRDTELTGYLDAVSKDFVTLSNELAKAGYHQAVATSSDPLWLQFPYNSEGYSLDTHICGPELATSLITTHCTPQCLSSFKTMVGWDINLHGEIEGENDGKRYHLR